MYQVGPQRLPAPGPGRRPLSRAQLQQMLSKLLQFARCMRSHGVPDFPDPDSVGLRVAPSVTHLPQYQTAYQACKSLLPRNAPVKGAVPGGGS